MNTELTLLITRSANIYFWLFISMCIFEILNMSTENYKKRKETLERLGKVQNSFSLINLIVYFLFILSMYYK
jgi:hypothetical protein